MKTLRSFQLLLLAATTVLLPAAQGAEAATSTIKFSDPAKPGTLKVQVGRGDLRITAGDTPEVIVKSDVKTVTKAERKDGLRILTATSSFSLTEKDNVVTLDDSAAIQAVAILANRPPVAVFDATRSFSALREYLLWMMALR